METNPLRSERSWHWPGKGTAMSEGEV